MAWPRPIRPTSGASQLTVDVACAADPYLDLIFRGLPSIPVAGTEQNAASLVVVPGGIANVAYALGRLGLAAIICAPRGEDPAGRFLAEVVADAGVTWIGRASDVTPVTVSLPTGGDRALVSVMPPPTVDPRPSRASPRGPSSSICRRRRCCHGWRRSRASTPSSAIPRSTCFRAALAVAP